MNGHSAIPATELKKISASGGAIVDVRTKAEHEEKRISLPHDHVPLDSLDPENFMMRRGLDREDPVYILCRSGGRARQAAEKFAAAGYPNVHVIEGGIIACESCGHEMAGASPPGDRAGLLDALRKLPLERQAQVVAGTVIMLGVLMGAALASFFYLIPLAAGAGLVYAGITGSCAVAGILAGAPWNKSCAATSSSCGLGEKKGGCS